MLLLFVVLIPFATSTEADYFPDNDWDAQLARWCFTAGCSSACRPASARSSSGRCTASGCTSRCRPERHWPARARFVGGGLVYVLAIVIALFNAVASFVLIALVAVYYIVEHTPVYPAIDALRRRRARGLKASQD